MTVTIPPQDDPDLTLEDKREHVIAYLSLPHGTKTTYLTEHGINPRSIHRWKQAMADGNLEQGLIPRQTGCPFELSGSGEPNAQWELSGPTAQEVGTRSSMVGNSPMAAAVSGELNASTLLA